MTFIEAKFEQIETEWRELYKNAQNISPYMSYDFQKNYKKQLYAGRKTFFASYIVYKAYENDILIAIIPLIKIKRKIYIAGDLRATGYLDFIYSSAISDIIIEKMFAEFIAYMHKYEIHFNKINQSSRTFRILKKLETSGEWNIKQRICLNIAFGDKYEDYFSTLSKSTRQNIRTAHNRLIRENKSLSVETYIGKNIDKKENKELMNIYSKRQMERIGTSEGGRMLVEFFQEKLNPLTLSLNCSENSFLSILRIDSEIAAYMHGFISGKNEAAVIPRLAINSDFNVYCPGGLLITETIKWLIDNTTVRNLDLSRGDEKYKYVYGGTEHYNFDYIINNRKIDR